LDFLAKTATLPWDRIWVQGGAITARRSPSAGVYEVSQLTLGSTAPLWISAEAADVKGFGLFGEVFFMAVGPDKHLDDPEHEKQWRPLRSELASLPPDLLLAQFREPPRTYQLITLSMPAGSGSVLVDNGLLVTNPMGARLLFYCDDQTPLDMFITTNAAAIEGYLSGAVTVRSIPD
jgi:hypothetical protein